ncbi:hypothetical protein ACFOY8_13185 [Thalassospira xianhensis]|uniref:Uncharacterized protein n=1 Tax=Thalassospira xianhensis MCCC 1A02616 TaxID=1177929 RepID=A0A367UL34_9PROT|nr:hypothetical protein [Thalassospira xianhensis]RCK07842.1 hypothetical protein TH5_02105 [Thalassospira xianhensis MCCC 1A02616]
MPPVTAFRPSGLFGKLAPKPVSAKVDPKVVSAPKPKSAPGLFSGAKVSGGMAALDKGLGVSSSQTSQPALSGAVEAQKIAHAPPPVGIEDFSDYIDWVTGGTMPDTPDIETAIEYWMQSPTSKP